MNSLIFSVSRFLKNHGGKILTGLSLVGLGTTAFAAAKGAKKEEELLYEQGDDNQVKIFLKSYWPAFVSGTATAASIVGIELLGEKKEAALIAACTAVGQQYKKYRDKNVEVNGEGAHENIVKAMASEYLTNPEYCIRRPGMLYSGDEIDYVNGGSDNALFYDEVSGIFFWSTQLIVRDAIYHLNRNFQILGDVNIQEFYDLLGIGDIPFTTDANLGWSAKYLSRDYNVYWIDISMELCGDASHGDFYRLHYGTQPIEEYQDFYVGEPDRRTIYVDGEKHVV